ncbi:MAG: amidohydrolase family protein [Pseudomonadota bacterium]|nr:amidohydrolase family protein [Pseudomonadota bacterium]
MTPDIVIRGGLIFDGFGNPGRLADVAIGDGKIVGIGQIERSGLAEIDADGLFVTPGFIDIHSHSDYTLLAEPRAVSAIAQGVTLEVIGNCGHGCFPLVNQPLARNSIYGLTDDIPLDWSTPAAYLERLEAARPAVNVLTLVPNGQLRQATIGLRDGPATSDERNTMIRHLEEGLEAGAFGFSTGLEYPIEVGADQNEIEALLAPVARREALYATHTRRRDDGAPEAVDEAIQTARSAGVRLQISHLLPRGGRADCEACIERVETAYGAGQDIAFDMHTRTFALTFLNAMLPPWAMEGGLKGLRTLIGDEDKRVRILAFPSIVSSGGWGQVTLLDNAVVPQFARLNFETIAGYLGKSAGDAALELLCWSAEAAQPLMIIRPVYSAVDQELAFSHPLCVPGSDATSLAPDGRLASSAFHGAYSWAAWFFRFMVRERGLLSPEAAIHKLTGQPAGILDLGDRGILRCGAAADIAIFDPETFGERATQWEPNCTATGMKHVLVNGERAFEAGELTGRRSGRVIRRN